MSEQANKDSDMKESTQQPELQHITSLTGFLEDVMRLSVYAVKNGQLPDEIEMDELYRMWEIKVSKKETLSEADISYLQDCYQTLSVQLAPITAISLRATENKYTNCGSNQMNTAAGKYVRNLWVISFSVLTLIVFTNIYQYMFETDAANIAKENVAAFDVANYIYTFITNLIPFLYGAFGACIFILRQAEEQLRERTFDPRRQPEYRNRLVLGTLSGGVIVLLYSSGGSEADIKITEAALGFIGGYSIDLIFSLLDRIVNTLKPAEKPTSRTPGGAPAISSKHRRSGDKILIKNRMQKTKGENEAPPQLVPVTSKGSDSVI